MPTAKSVTGAAGPRIDVVMRMFDRILEYEDEVRRGKRIPQTVLNAKLRERTRSELTTKRHVKRAANKKGASQPCQNT